jgi:hypothetical protein
MEEVFEHIHSGDFAERLSRLDDSGLSEVRRALRRLTDPRLERAARKFSRH